MKPLKIVWLSDFDVLGSGYQNISTIVCDGLVKLGHEVKAVGLHYMGQEHNHEFSIVPIMSLRDAVVSIYNLRALWNFDVLVVALDIPHQNNVMREIQSFRTMFKYVGIMPVEADPLCMSWAMILLQMDLPMIISKFGTEEAHKANVGSAKHLQLGVDTNLWKMPAQEEKQKYRKSLFGITDDRTFTVLTIADNQERKNLSAGLEAFKIFSAAIPDSRYILVTRENNPAGWALRDLIFEYGIQDKVIIMERGMPKEELQMVYASADCFLLPSKAEGLGLPLLEAMSVGVPCIATYCTGMKELLDNGRGYLIEHTMIHRDPFGNGKRYWINIEKTVEALMAVYMGITPDVNAARALVESMKWEDTVFTLNAELEKMMEI